MKPLSLIAIMMLSVFASANAQKATAEDSVRAVVDRLFDAMRAADTAALRSCFAADAVLGTVQTDASGRATLREEPVTGFVEFVGRQERGAADERITFGAVLVDGPLASVWTPYRFHYKGAFSHCGVNLFRLLRGADGWRIRTITDTRRKSPCE